MEKINKFQNVLAFEKYIRDRTDDEFSALLKLLKDNFDNVFIYSGIIRNFFIGYQGNCYDIDIVVQDKNINKESDEYISDLINENFPSIDNDLCDGYGLSYLIGKDEKNVNVDIWGMNNSIGFQYFYEHRDLSSFP